MVVPGGSGEDSTYDGPEFPIAYEDMQGKIIARWRHEEDANDGLDAFDRIEDLALTNQRLTQDIAERDETILRQVFDLEQLEAEWETAYALAIEQRDDWEGKFHDLEADVVELREDSGL